MPWLNEDDAALCRAIDNLQPGQQLMLLWRDHARNARPNTVLELRIVREQNTTVYDHVYALDLGARIGLLPGHQCLAAARAEFPRAQQVRYQNFIIWDRRNNQWTYESTPHGVLQRLRNTIYLQDALWEVLGGF